VFFCQNAIESAARDKDEMFAEQLACKEYYVCKLQELFGSLSGSTKKQVTFHEFAQKFEEHEMKAYFAMLDMDTSDAWTLFKLLDTSSSQMINLEEFVDGCLCLRGPARSIDLAKMSYETRWMMNQLSELIIQVKRSAHGKDA